MNPSIISSPSASEIPVADSFDHGDIASAASSAGPDTSARLRLIEQAIEDLYEELAGLLDDETLIAISREDYDAEFVVSTALRCLAWSEVVAAQKLADQLRALVVSLAVENPGWGYTRLRDVMRHPQLGGRLRS